MLPEHFPQAFFFDFDGVLVDSVHLKSHAFRELFKDCSEEVIENVLEYHRLHGGISRVEKIRYAYEDVMHTPLDEQEHQRLAAKYSDLVMDKVIAAAWIAGAESFLEKYHRNRPVFVISGTPEDELRQVIRQRGINSYFQEILGSPRKKPDHIRALLKTYNLDPAHCVFIGDALTDLNAAAETGMHFVGIQGDVRFPDTISVVPNCTLLETAIARIAADPAAHPPPHPVQMD